MYKGMYIAASGALQRSQEMDTIANNLANVNTNGFKRNKQSARFYPVLEGTARQSSALYPNARGMTSAGTFAIDTAPGAYQFTGNPLDLALSGDTFFAVEKNGTTFYTRSGNFTLDREGFVSTQDGYKLVDRGNQPIVIDNTEGAVSVSGDGIIYLLNVQQKSNTLVAEIKITKLADIQHAGGSLYTGTEVETTDFDVSQGVVERSNVSPVSETIAMINAQRQFEMAQKVVQNFDELAQKALSALASVTA
ncbi:MAG TPA: flagellar hook basal-body protein [Dissulfurispiraceae bacterium]|nr:flagellar hook basal-body protein [Dissulfurispiraceae bacterium]